MDIRVAKTAGFCFGVARAVDRTYRCADETEKKYCTLGPIIHNAQVVNDLIEKGVNVIDSLDNLPANTTVIIRTHGVSESVYQELKEKNIPYLDLTCPFVKKSTTLSARTTLKAVRSSSSVTAGILRSLASMVGVIILP